MAKVYGADKIRRTCLIKGRENEGRFGLLRKQLNVSMVLAPGTEGEGEAVDTNLVYDERITPRPARTPTKPTAEMKVHPADKPLRRVCFLHGHGEKKFHLLRKGVELSKVLEVGKEGTGDWVKTEDIHDEYNAPIPSKTRPVERKPVRLCKLARTGDQEYLILRKTPKGAKLVPVYDGNYGFVETDLSQIVDEHTINQAKKGKKDKKGDAGDQEQSSNGEQMGDGSPDSGNPLISDAAAQTATPAQPATPTQPVPVAAQAAPVAAQAAPVAAQAVPQTQVAPPVQPAPVAAQPPRPVPTAAQPQRPAPVQPGVPRAGTVAPAGAAPRAPQGRPVGR